MWAPNVEVSKIRSTILGVFTIRFTVASSLRGFGLRECGAMGMVHVALFALDYFAGLLFRDLNLK